MRHTYYVLSGELYHYQTGARLRTATRREKRASIEAVRHDGGAGVIGESDLSRPVSRRTLAAIERRMVRS